MQVGAVIVDFDGTACSHDVAEHLLREFAHEDWEKLDDAWERGRIGSQEVVAAQSAMLDADRDDACSGFAARTARWIRPSPRS